MAFFSMPNSIRVFCDHWQIVQSNSCTSILLSSGQGISKREELVFITEWLNSFISRAMNPFEKCSLQQQLFPRLH
jgi:hypothetical protein